MPELVLTRTARRAGVYYALAGVGRLRLVAWTSRRETAAAGGRRWEIARRGVWQGVIRATGEAD